MKKQTNKQALSSSFMLQLFVVMTNQTLPSCKFRGLLLFFFPYVVEEQCRHQLKAAINMKHLWGPYVVRTVLWKMMKPETCPLCWLFLDCRDFSTELGLIAYCFIADVCVSSPDKKSIMMYIMCCYQVLSKSKKNSIPVNIKSIVIRTCLVSFIDCCSLNVCRH